MSIEPKNILFYIPNATLGFHFETELELIQNHLDSNDQVTIYTCKKALKESSYFSCLGFGKCYYCIERRKVGFAALQIKRENQLKIVEIPNMNSNTARHYINNLNQLRDYKYKKVDVGMATASTLISRYRKPYLNFNKYKNKILKAIDVTNNLVNYFEKVLTNNHYDLIYLFNGRFNIYRPLVRLAQQHNILFYTHERGSSINKYELYENTIPHDIENLKKTIHDTWSLSDDPLKSKIGEDWYTNRRKGDLQSWYSFISSQKNGEIPLIDKHKKIIAIFPSSQDEFEAIQGWENHLFKSQNDGINSILNHFKDSNDFIFIVRSHPNLAGISNKQTKELRQLKSLKNCIYIAPEAAVDTYALIEIANKVITFGSTVGTESTFWEKASILAGRSVYESLDCTYNPKTKNELFDLIKNSDLKATKNQKDNSLKFAYYYATFGKPFIHFKAISLSKGLFRGQLIRPSKVITYGVGFFWYLYNLKYVLSGQMSFSLFLNKIKGNLKSKSV